MSTESRPVPLAVPPLTPAVQSAIVCPRCRGDLEWNLDRVTCLNEGCGRYYPVSHGVGVLIDADRSVFDPVALVEQRPRVLGGDSPLRARVMAGLPAISRNISADRVYGDMRDRLLLRLGQQRVLVIGSGLEGAGFAALHHERLEFTFTDVAFGPQTQLIADAHDVPFRDGTFDAVILQAVLEHVLDPVRVVAEAHRVLDETGLVFAETPFMQQVHLGAYDFTRFTRLGHRWLFRHFTDLDTGVACGPGMATAWSLQYLMLSYARTRRSAAGIRLLSRLLLFWLSLLDVRGGQGAGASDAASAFYFLGQRSDTPLTPRELLAAYDGLMAS